MNEAAGRKLVYRRSDGMCEACFRCSATEWHHRKARSAGGSWEPSNGLHLDHWCHQWITEHPNAANERGWLLKSHQKPRLEAAVITSLGRWCYLTDSGIYVPVNREIPPAPKPKGSMTR